MRGGEERRGGQGPLVEKNVRMYGGRYHDRRSERSNQEESSSSAGGKVSCTLVGLSIVGVRKVGFRLG